MHQTQQSVGSVQRILGKIQRVLFCASNPVGYEKAKGRNKARRKVRVLLAPKTTSSPFPTQITGCRHLTLNCQLFTTGADEAYIATTDIGIAFVRQGIPGHRYQVDCACLRMVGFAMLHMNPPYKLQQTHHIRCCSMYLFAGARLLPHLKSLSTACLPQSGSITRTVCRNQLHVDASGRAFWLVHYSPSLLA